ncbi:MAG: histidine kinase [Bacteroidota bacterium]
METTQRQTYLDWLRILSILGVLIFHSAMPYVAEDGWHIKNALTSNLLMESNLFLHLFRMPLLFFISGTVSYYMMQRRSTLSFIGLRFRRLLIPLIAGMFIKILLEKVTNDHLETELKFLKAQYHPHFMFNALNTIYFQMDEDIQGAKESIETFSELLRYQLYDQQLQVPIIQEIGYLQSFIALRKIRSTDKLILKVDFDPQLDNQLVYPLLFLPLIENAFKFIGGNYQLSINAAIDAEYIIFNIENAIPANLGATRTNGIGLENMKRRLNLLYPDKHVLNLIQNRDQFKATLKLKYVQ